ncbi:related to endo-1,3(4)-beta-glucanase [Ustilago bromivora]|uniref:Related to endo-1,3(4)-beta-glucanase n=1 Tax=Ustilago bromivora TaxID=307758 RepID=A0A1K0G1W1_9BASI|nr:related to endo-1,3(4)-beta-glucanase [Ustilago bromivora]SYW78061.1 related to endo-1,3(4)-beta-glucanase [Ustilago bromivora]
MLFQSTSSLTALTVVLVLSSAVLAGNYTLRDEITGRQFLDRFWFWSYNDPTHGTVNYVDQFTAIANRLAYVNSNNHFVIRADNTSVVPPGRGRQSVRMHSKRTVGDGIIVGKFSFMPQGCATWPAFWTCTNGNWPTGGEIDIVEGANDQGPRNLASLHTLYGCHIPSGSRSDQLGITSQTDCSYQPGCSASFTADNSFGPNFNRNGGGYFAVRRETRPGDRGIGVYFWPITSSPSSLPSAVAALSDGVSTPKYVVTNSNATGNDRSELNKWGTPSAFFANTANSSATPASLAGGDGSVCEMNKFFDEHTIIINLSLCGDWAGETFALSGCAARYNNLSCDNFVRNYPQAFSDARWEINYMRIYDNAASLKGRPAAMFYWMLSVLVMEYLFT